MVNSEFDRFINYSKKKTAKKKNTLSKNRLVTLTRWKKYCTITAMFAKIWDCARLYSGGCFATSNLTSFDSLSEKPDKFILGAVIVATTVNCVLWLCLFCAQKVLYFSRFLAFEDDTHFHFLWNDILLSWSIQTNILRGPAENWITVKTISGHLRCTNACWHF